MTTADSLPSSTRPARSGRSPPEDESTQGLAWSPVWRRECGSRAPIRGSARALEAATLDRTCAHGASCARGSCPLGDVGADGRALLVHENARRGIFGLAPGETKERDLSWLDWSQPVALSEDGKTLLVTEEADGGGPGYSVYLRKTDGSPAVRLGGGEALALSPDGKWVIAQRLNPSPAQLVLMPTGAGEARALTNDAIMHLGAAFVGMGKQFVFTGFEPNKARERSFRVCRRAAEAAHA